MQPPPSSPPSAVPAPGSAVLARLPRAFRRRPGWWLYLSALGPGLIAAVAGNDAGGIATYSSVGAAYGYDLLWMLVLVAFSLVVVQEMCARMGAVTGKGLSDLIRENFGPRWTTFAMLTLLVANTATTMTEFAGIGAAGEIFGISRYITIPISAAVVWWLVVKGSYERVERLFLLLALAFFAYPISALLARPDWGVVARSTVSPSFHFESRYLLMFVATVGATVTPYMQLFQQSSVVEKGITTADYRYERFDVIVGSLFSSLVAFSIIVATAATLHLAGQTEIGDAADAARALEPLAGQFAGGLFAVGLFGASMLAAGVLPLATAYSLTEAFGWEKGISQGFSEAPIFYSLFTGQIVLGALAPLWPNLPIIEFLVVVQVLNGLLMPVMLVFITKLAGNRELMGRYGNGPRMSGVAWTIAGTMAALALLMLAATLLPLAGIHPS
ncbi:MAG: Nramp family divalent metal transporter [Chloroflexi bacterium]|nr:Nramp family divalent metal transporter [Chloroflexota bacterium]